MLRWIEIRKKIDCAGNRAIHCPCCPLAPDCIWRMRAALLILKAGRRVREQIVEGIAEFREKIGAGPDYIFFASMPRGAAIGDEMEDALLMEADWVPRGTAALVARWDGVDLKWEEEAI